jgi:hypothetical protein
MAVKRLRKPKHPQASLMEAMAQSSRRPRILYSQGRAEKRDHGARHAAIGGAFTVGSLPTEGTENANGNPVSGSDRGSVKPSR